MTRRLEAAELRPRCDPATLSFRSTEELPPLAQVIGQERAVGATAFGIRIRNTGYNMFVLGPPATGKTTTMRRVLADRARSEPTPPDCVYVYNFADAYRPAALMLPAGRGRELREAMARLVEECRTRLPRAFEGEEFEREKARLLEELAGRQRAELQQMEEAARAEGFVLVRTHGAFAVVPAPRGEPLSGEEFAALPEATRQRLEARGQELEARLEATLRQLRQHERAAREAHGELVRKIAATATRRLVQELREDFQGLDPVQRYLEQVEQDLIAHAEEFRGLEEARAPLPFLPAPGAFLDRYRVNVLVDRSEERGAPVVFEPNPTHGNLLGRIEHRAQLGTLVTDFTLIRPGALHRANGGYLLLEAKEVLRSFLAWDTLKKALKGGSIRIEEPLEEFRLITAASLQPAAVPLDVKVILVGSPLLYYLLHALDEDFPELFKVKVDFDDSFPRTPETEHLYGRFVGTLCREEGLRHFSAGGVAALVDHGSRLVAHRERLTARLGALLDVVREASFWAGERQHALVAAEDVMHAVEQRRFRANLVEERLGRLVAEGTLVIATQGRTVGQVNGISVLVLGDHAFGRASRITARTFAGQPGVVDVAREVKLGGPIHSKGVMTLTGYLAGRYAREHPLALSASITFEQQYEEVEGDSASSAELYALLSSLAGVPLRQDLAVTGAVDQRGEIQAVGGVNEKIEGFFDTCRARGLTGTQGVLIPAANARHLVLRPEVVEAVGAGRFHVHAVGTVDEGLELLTGRPAGERGADGRFPPGSVNAAVDEALAANVARLRAMRGADGGPAPAHKEGTS
jgi:lon-related putative ATP-dependent protease